MGVSVGESGEGAISPGADDSVTASSEGGEGDCETDTVGISCLKTGFNSNARACATMTRKSVSASKSEFATFLIELHDRTIAR